MGLHVVHRVVEPQREFDLAGMVGEVAGAIEQVQAFAQVLQRVVVALGLAPGRDQPVEEAGVAPSQAQRPPSAVPGRQAHAQGNAFWTSRPSSITAMA